MTSQEGKALSPSKRTDSDTHRLPRYLTSAAHQFYPNMESDKTQTSRGRKKPKDEDSEDEASARYSQVKQRALS